jgi:hemolysin activation/secretion protein
VLLGAEAPVNITPLQERLQLLQQDQRIERINAELRPGTTRGESVLNLKVKEASPFKAWLDFNNYQTPVVGAERGLATVAHQNVTGNGDIFSFTYGRSRGVNPIIDTSYALPLNRYDTIFSAYYRRNAFVVVEAPFQSLNIDVDAEIIGMSLRQPIYRTLSDELAVAVVGEHVFNRNTIGGIPFDFFPGSQNGVATVSALRFVQEYTHRTSNAVIAARSRFSVGLDVLGATINPREATTLQGQPLASGRYFAWLGQAQAVRRFDDWWGMQLLAHMDLQVANNALFPLEQFPVGGRFTVRGYRENSLVRDNAFVASVESRFPLLKFPSGEDRLQFAQFVDVGRAWNARVTTPEPHTLASVGVGLRWNILPQERARFEVYWGQQLNHFRTGEGNLQDHGVHLQMVVQAL